MFAPTAKILGANKRVRLGICGANGRGGYLMSVFAGEPDVEIAWLIDPERRLQPASHDVYEGRVAYEAAKKYGVVVQHGTQSRSSTHWVKLVKAIQSGRYGRLAVSHAFCCKRRGGIGFEEPSAPPEWLDWNIWKGPAIPPVSR